MPTAEPSSARSDAIARTAACSSGTVGDASAGLTGAPLAEDRDDGEPVGAIAGCPGASERAPSGSRASATLQAMIRSERNGRAGIGMAITERWMSRWHRSRERAWEALALAGLLLITCANPGCAPERPLVDATTPTIEVIVGNDPETLDPRYATDAVGLRATRLLHAGLIRLDPDTLAPVPYAARSWRWLDERTLRVDLREGLFFHSGSPFLARDVVETLRALASPEVASRHARALDAIASVEEAGDHAVVFRLSRPHATLLTDLEVPILRAEQARSPASPSGSLDGLGPYSLASVRRGEVRLVPAAGGPLPRPAYAITLRAVHDENARALRLEAGQSDVALNLISPTLLPALAAQPGLAVVSRPGANLTYVVVQEERAPLNDVRVRQALSRSIDREAITRGLLAGHAQPASGLIAPANWAHATASVLELDRDGAGARLDQAGFPIDRTRKLRLSLLTSTERVRGDIARAIAEGWGDLGVEVSVVPLELGTMIARLSAGDFDLAILQLPEMTEPDILRHFLHSAFVPPAGANRGRVRDPLLDTLLDQGDREANPHVRQGIYRRVEERAREEQHWLPLWYEDQVAVTSFRARAFVPSAEGRWLGLAELPPPALQGRAGTAAELRPGRTAP